LARLTEQSPALAEAVALAQDFAELIRRRQPARLDPWLRRAAQSALPSFRRFAKGLRADMVAVQALAQSLKSSKSVEQISGYTTAGGLETLLQTYVPAGKPVSLVPAVLASLEEALH
jgi:transposase